MVKLKKKNKKRLSERSWKSIRCGWKKKYTNIYLLKNKSDAFEKFQDFLKEVENQFGRKIKRIKSDRGLEYESSAFNSFVQSWGIIHETTAPYLLASNGVAERKK